MLRILIQILHEWRVLNQWLPRRCLYQQQCKRWMDRDWIGIHQSTNPRLIHWLRGYGSRSNRYPFVALLRQCHDILRTLLAIHPLNDTRTPPNWYAYTPYLIWFKCFLIKLEYHVRLTCLRLYRENQSASPYQYFAQMLRALYKLIH